MKINCIRDSKLIFSYLIDSTTGYGDIIDLLNYVSLEFWLIHKGNKMGGYVIRSHTIATQELHNLQS